ncbi:MAG: exonuclease domain-containing protein, partial [Actinomycetota bacterium]
MLAEPVQTTLQEGIPLREVTFCIVDLETTGGSSADSRITEIGAVKYRDGERIGVFETLVAPGTTIPRFITHLTGIDDAIVRDAPTLEWALP